MLNGEVASKMQSIFTKRGIPVVPSLGVYAYMLVWAAADHALYLDPAAGNNDVWRESAPLYVLRSKHA